MHRNQVSAARSSRPRCFTVRITDFGLKSLKKTVRRNGRFRGEVDCIIDKIVRNPEAGRELTSDLFGMKVVTSEDGKYRVVYEVDDARREVVVHAVGGRRHVYDDLARILKRIMPYTGSGSFGKWQDRNDDQR